MSAKTQAAVRITPKVEPYPVLSTSSQMIIRDSEGKERLYTVTVIKKTEDKKQCFQLTKEIWSQIEERLIKNHTFEAKAISTSFNLSKKEVTTKVLSESKEGNKEHKTSPLEQKTHEFADNLLQHLEKSRAIDISKKRTSHFLPQSSSKRLKELYETAPTSETQGASWLEDGQILSYLKHLQDAHKNFKYIRFLDHRLEQMIQTNNLSIHQDTLVEAINLALEEDKTKIAIPIHTGGHFVTIFIDTEVRNIEYYDPKGISLEQRGDVGITISHFIENLQKNNPQTNDFAKKVFQNQYQHQSERDSSNCGIFVLNYIEQRLDGFSSDVLHSSAITEEQIMEYRRTISSFLPESL